MSALKQSDVRRSFSPDDGQYAIDRTANCSGSRNCMNVADHKMQFCGC
jgi:hypothetical protein